MKSTKRRGARERASASAVLDPVTGNDPSLNSVYKPLLVMLALAVLMGLMKILEFYMVPEDDHRR